MSLESRLRTIRLLSTLYSTHKSHLSPIDFTLQRGHIEATVKGSAVENESS